MKVFRLKPDHVLDRTFHLNNQTVYYVNGFRAAKSFSEKESNSEVHILHVAWYVAF